MAKVNVSAWNQNNGILAEKEAETPGELLTEFSLNPTEVAVEVTDAQGEERKYTAGLSLNAGDTVIIMKSKNKSGR